MTIDSLRNAALSLAATATLATGAERKKDCETLANEVRDAATMVCVDEPKGVEHASAKNIFDVEAIKNEVDAEWKEMKKEILEKFEKRYEKDSFRRLGVQDIDRDLIPLEFRDTFGKEEGGTWRINTIRDHIVPNMMRERLTKKVLSVSGDVLDGKVDANDFAQALESLDDKQKISFSRAIKTKLEVFGKHWKEQSDNSGVLDKNKLQQSFKDRLPFLLQMGKICVNDKVFIEAFSEKALTWNLSFLKGKTKNSLVKELWKDEKALNTLIAKTLQECDSFIENRYEEDPKFGWGANNISAGMHRILFEHSSQDASVSQK